MNIEQKTQIEADIEPSNAQVTEALKAAEIAYSASKQPAQQMRAAIKAARRVQREEQAGEHAS